MSVIIYGITRSGHPAPMPPPPGIGHPPGQVHLVRFGPLAAAVSVTADVGILGESEAVRHLDILQRLLAGGPVLPLRFGTVAPDEAAVCREVLAPLADEMPDRLDALEGLVELHLDVEEDERSALTEVLPGSPFVGVTPSADLDARIRLGQQVADLVIARRQRQADAILDLLRPLALSDRPRRPHGGADDPVLSWAFLLRDAAVDAFDAAVADLRRACPYFTIEYVGPLPAIDFAEDPTGPPEAGDTADADAFGGTGRWGWSSDSDIWEGNDQ
ncbi:GvpL/GvpF family gas vesicle protein [Frankia sp. B2]|uniref:GvpL/GvpF family gas vesicle protein n=1 Tax=Frankia sp. B2 TaxID=2541730 RepID=UPI00106DB027|nr:GvpL/GvpF family gas vesicle protein [Frankia sp. B2]TFE30183.1 GvpL/GvpF family gas vesicle protein [Frankia sp. B2]